MINPIIFAEVSVSFPLIEDAEAAMSVAYLEREQISYDAAFLAGKALLGLSSSWRRKAIATPGFLHRRPAAVADMNF